MSATAEHGGGRVAVGVDGSASSMTAVAWAAREASLLGAELELVTAWEWPLNFGAPMLLPDDFNPEKDGMALLEETEAAVRRDYPDLVVRKTVREGHAAPILVEASKGATMLVVGSRGHGAFVGMVIGSVSEHCVANAKCPVLVVRD
jgi:nucleotide-binding universal stress UspA family protein